MARPGWWRRRAAVGALLAVAACSGEAPGFDTPESVLPLPGAGVWLVSNVNGAPTAKDGNGYIARVAPDGSMQRRWIAGGRDGVTLHAPKGMAIANGVLWVADIDVVRKFDLGSGAPLGEVAVPGSTFLNDVSVAPDGAVYVSDSGFDPSFGPSGTDAIWRIAPDGALAALVRGTDLGQPNGIVATASGVYVVNWRDGAFFQIDYRGVRTDLGKAPTAQLDGLVRVAASGGGAPAWIATSWAGSCVYRFDVTGGVTKLPPTLAQPADCGFDAERGVLVVPLFGEHRLEQVRP
jgi:hypothetical protein